MSIRTGLVEGALMILDHEKAQARARAFGLSVDVVTARLAVYGRQHETKTPIGVISDRFLKAIK